jgi:hypothetical protein
VRLPVLGKDGLHGRIGLPVGFDRYIDRIGPALVGHGDGPGDVRCQGGSGRSAGADNACDRSDGEETASGRVAGTSWVGRLQTCLWVACYNLSKQG